MDLDTKPTSRTMPIVVGSITAFVVVAVVAWPLLPFPETASDGEALGMTTSSTVRTVPVAEVLTFEAAANRVVRAAAPDEVSSNDDGLRVDAAPFVASVIAFDVPAITGGIASSNLTVTPVTEVGAPLRARIVASDWEEASLTYRRRPARLSPEYAESTLMPDGSLHFDLSGMVDPGARVSIWLEATSATLVRLSSRDGPDPPTLEITRAPAGTSPPTIADAEVEVTKPTTTWRPIVRDDDGDVLRCMVRRRPRFGTVEVAPDCSEVVYRAGDSATGSDRIDIAVDDGIYSVTGTVALAFDPLLGRPKVEDAVVFRAHDLPREVRLRAVDASGKCPLDIEVTSTPDVGSLGEVSTAECSHGFAVATVTYHPPEDEDGGDRVSFEYAATNASGGVSDPARVTVVSAVGRPVLRLEPSLDVVVGEDAEKVPMERLRIDAEPTSLAYLRFDVSEMLESVGFVRLVLHVESDSFEGIEVFEADPDWDASASGDRVDHGDSPLAVTGPIWGGEWIDIPLRVDVVGDGVFAVILTTQGSRAISIGSTEGSFSPAIVIGTGEGVG